MELKFKAFDTDTSKFLWTGFDRFTNERHQDKLIGERIGWLIMNSEYSGLGNRVIFLQYVGKTDKNGNEIYNGDIIDDGFGNLFVIEWFQDHCQFIAARDGDDQEIGDWCIVVGNKYSNPELLQSL